MFSANFLIHSQKCPRIVGYPKVAGFNSGAAKAVSIGLALTTILIKSRGLGTYRHFTNLQI